VIELLRLSKTKMEERIPKAMHSVGLIMQLEELQNHQNTQIYSRAVKAVTECWLSKSEVEHE